MDTNATHPGNPVNEPNANVPRQSSRIPLDQTRLQTHRFGEYSVHMIMDTIKKDVLPYRHEFDLRTFSLKAPLMQNIAMRNDYFNVPMEAILPFNWEIIVANPTFGDDVPDYCNTTDIDAIRHIRNMMLMQKANIENLMTNSGTNSEVCTEIVKWALMIEMFYSHGSLLAECGCKLAQFVEITRLNADDEFDLQSPDKFVEFLLDNMMIKSFVATFTKQDGSTEVYPVYNATSIQSITIHNFLEKARQNLNFKLEWTDDQAPWEVDGQEQLEDLLTDNTAETWTFTFIDVANQELKLARLFAYQIVCAHFYSNDQIDPVFSADTFRKLISSYVHECMDDIQNDTTFTYNGIEMPYDWCSAYYFKEIALAYDPANNSTTLLTNTYNYLTAIFSHRRSLRKVDYFTGARTLPQAVADTNVAVTNNMVSAINITRGIQMQRYANAVQRFGRKIENYLEGLFPGQKVGYDYHNPAFLAHTNDVIFGEEVENTATDQQKNNGFITTNLRSNASKFMFEFYPDRPGIIIGITYFDIDRLYTHVIERDFFHKNRFEEFNPMMQYVGDQPIYRQELGIRGTARQPFAYTIRYMEYKQMINEAIGGAVENLPAWSFKDRPGNINLYENAYIGSDFIRSKCWELDQFYSSLTGNTLASYFHFIIKHVNKIDAKRPMAYNPGIL